MAIAPGTRIGVYSVVSLIGKGGMGEVYRAHDTRLNRDVALKVLPEAFSRDSERMARFEREAKVLASLNHPNIAAIYGLEESGPTRALVMELVEGPTLAERIRSGAIPVDEALPIARQVADAVEYAHDKNVIHRDLKPANIKVTAEGTVKVLDFGLAKALSEEVAAEDMSNSPTLSMAATRQGVILGTAAYMSPEQARGKTVDRRTDVWALGVVLYEMLTGKQAFQGEDVTEILVAVMSKEPSLDALPAKTPSAIRNLLRRCLERNLRRRLSHIAEARMVIEDVLSGTASAESVGASGAPVLGRRALVLVLAGLLAGSLVAAIAVWNLKPTPVPTPRPVSRTVVALPPGERFDAEVQPIVAVSPDGSNIAYVAVQGGTQQLYLRSLDSLEARPIPGTEGATNPFFSPDGQWLGFFADGKLKKVSVNGGAALALTDVSLLFGASWSSEGMIVFASNTNGPLEQISAAGGSPQSLTTLEKGESANRWPQFLPGGNAVLFTSGSGGNFRVSVYSITTGKRQNLIEGASSPSYSPTGHLLYVQGGTLMAVPFDSQKLQLTGAAFPVVESVLGSSNSGAAQYSISTTGSLIYLSGGLEGTQNKLVSVSRNGTEQLLPAPPHAYRAPRLSPDGQKIAVGIEEQGFQVWLYDLPRQTLTRLTFDGNTNQYPVWTPDGNRIAFESSREGTGNMFWQLADGSGGVERLYKSDSRQVPTSFSSDGQLLAFAEVNSDTGYDIGVVRLSDHKAQPFLRTRFNEGTPRFSPDGHWLAYPSDESGRREIYVQPYPGPGGKYQISTEGGTEPVWNRNGRELFFRSGNKMMAVDIAAHPNLEVGQPRLLFERAYVPTALTFPNYDVSPDGQRFLMVKPNQETTALTQINVVQNWFEELKRRVPTGTK